MTAETSNASAADAARHSELKRLTISLYRRRWWVIGCTLSFALAAGIISFLVTPIYLAETTLVPAQKGPGAGMSGNALGQLGGLASLVGLSSGNKPEVTEAIALLKSRQFTEDFIRDKNLLPVLFADKWDSRLNRWRPGAKVPDLWDGYQLFNSKIRFVDQNKHAGTITLRIEWRDRKQAADWANALVRRVNRQMRQRAMTESAQTLGYLNAEAKKTTIVVVQNALQDLMEMNLKREAFADVTKNYVFTVVDPAAPPDRWDKLSPHKSIYVIVGFFFGFLVSVMAVMAGDGMRTVKQWLREGG